MPPNNIILLGAGVSGLTTAYLLSKDASNSITVVAKHMPGDYDIEYCSPWAGANYIPHVLQGVGQANSAVETWERNTWPVLADLAQNHPDAGIHFQEAIIYYPKKDGAESSSQFKENEQWYKKMVADFSNIPTTDLPADMQSGIKFTSVCINTAIYLPWLVGQCRNNGVVFKRASFKHVSDAASAHHSGHKADLVVNCTGLSSKSLGGVLDNNLYPARGQIVIARNDPGAMASISGVAEGDDEVVYMMTRAAGGGTVIGGSYQKNNWDSVPDPNLAVRIMKRAVALRPELVARGQGVEGIDIIRHGVGLRPVREGGPRIEIDEIDGVRLVHNYGHGGFGYQASYGCALDTVGLVNRVLRQKGRAKM